MEIARLKEAMPADDNAHFTHDQVEAMTMADRIVVMNAGRWAGRCGRWRSTGHPANQVRGGFLWVAWMNFVDPPLPNLSAQLECARRRAASAFRPEALRLASAEEGLTGQVILCERLGDAAILHLALDGGLELVAKVEGTAELGRGDTARLVVAPEAVHVFDRDGMAVVRP